MMESWKTLLFWGAPAFPGLTKPSALCTWAGSRCGSPGRGWGPRNFFVYNIIYIYIYIFLILLIYIYIHVCVCLYIYLKWVQVKW